MNGLMDKWISAIHQVFQLKVESSLDRNFYIAAVDGEAMQKALEMITRITAIPEEGTIYTGPVKKIAEFGAKAKDGKRCLSIKGTTLYSEDYEKDYFPFVFFYRDAQPRS